MDNCRFYKNTLPTMEDIVVVEIGNGSEYGYTVKLLEYNCVEGFVNLSELMKGRFKKKCVKTGDIVPMTILRIDKEKGHIDLSKRKVSDDAKNKTMEQYKYSTYLYKFGKEIYQMYKSFVDQLESKDTNLEFIMDLTIWRLYDEYEDESFDKIYNNILNNPTILFPNNYFSSDFTDKVINNINNRITRGNMIKEVDIHLLVTSKDGVNLIKKILSENTNLKNHEDYKDCKITVLVSSPPIYTIRVEAENDITCSNILKNVVDGIQQSALLNDSEFKIESDYRVVKESTIEFVFLSDYELNKI